MVSLASHRMGAKQWMNSINKELENLPPSHSSQESAHWSKRSIYRIPASVVDINSRAYNPHIVSFGPYHHGADNTNAMEKHKHRALLHFLKRSNQPLHAYFEALAPVVQDLKDAYDELGPEWHDTDKFLQLMIVDGCFILEILRAAAVTTSSASTTDPHQPLPPPSVRPQHQSRPQPDQCLVRDYTENDPIFSNHGKLHIFPYLKRDMLMLENQLPLLVLENLVDVQKDMSLKDRKDLTRRILNFFHQQLPANIMHAFDHSLHILDIYRKSLLLEEPRGMKHRPHQGGDEIIWSATELVEAGISISRSRSRSLKDISFHGGVLRLPLIMADDALEALYLNLIAFERFHVGAGNDVTSYIFFMDSIIDSSRDVRLLQTCGVIQNALGSDKAVAKLFNSVSKDITLDPDSSLGQVHKQVTAYCKKPCSYSYQSRAYLMHNYFTNPWVISAAAILLFSLIILHTIFTVLTYVNPP